MIAFQFPALLWLAPLAAAPLLLHLLGRTTPPPQDFPTTRFLPETPVPVRGRHTWQDIPLMLLRCLLLLILLLLAAGPHRQAEGGGKAVDALPEGHAVLLDASPSLSGTQGQLRPQLAALKDGHTAYWLVGAEASQTEAPETWGWGWESALGLPQAIRQAGQWLAQFAPSRRTLHLFTDLQAADWGGELGKVPPGTRIVFHLPEKPVRENCAILQVSALAADQGRLRIQARCRNWGREPALREALLETGGQVARASLLLPPNGEATASFLVEAPEDARGTLRLTPQDDFPFDDQRLFWARPAPPCPLAILLPDDRADRELARELEFFCLPALTAEPPGGASPFLLHPMGTSGCPFAQWDAMSAVLLLGSAERLPPEELLRLRNYVEEGGTLLSVPGNAPLVGWRRLQAAGLAPRGEAKESTRQTGLGEIPDGSPLARLFPPQDASDLHLFPIRRSLHPQVAHEDAQVLLATLEGAPALVRRPLGKGQCLLFTFGFHGAASDFAITKAFLPTLRELLEQSLEGRPQILQVPCGQSPPAPRPSLTGKASPPEYSTREPGLFQEGGQLVEVIPPPGESIPQYLPQEEVRRRLLPASPGETSLPGAHATAGSRPFLLPGAALLFLLLLGESLLLLRHRHRGLPPD